MTEKVEILSRRRRFGGVSGSASAGSAKHVAPRHVRCGCRRVLGGGTGVWWLSGVPTAAVRQAWAKKEPSDGRPGSLVSCPGGSRGRCSRKTETSPKHVHRGRALARPEALKIEAPNNNNTLVRDQVRGEVQAEGPDEDDCALECAPGALRGDCDVDRGWWDWDRWCSSRRRWRRRNGPNGNVNDTCRCSRDTVKSGVMRRSDHDDGAGC